MFRCYRLVLKNEKTVCRAVGIQVQEPYYLLELEFTHSLHTVNCTVLVMAENEFQIRVWGTKDYVLDTAAMKTAIDFINDNQAVMAETLMSIAEDYETLSVAFYDND